jgi:hypothetical protein
MQNENLFQPIEFWSEKIKLLDDRVKLIANTFGFGKVGLTLILKHGKVIDVTFSEEITVRQKENEKDKENVVD